MNPTSTEPAALYLHVHRPDSNPNRAAIVKLARERGFHVAGVFEEEPNHAHEPPARERLLLAAHNHEFSCVFLPTIRHLGRTPVEALEALAKLKSLVSVVSLTESWVAEPGAAVIAIAAWLSAAEAERKSASIRSGISRARAEGRRVGRPQKDIDLGVALALVKKMPMSKAANVLGCGASTLRRALALRREKDAQILVMNVEPKAA
jgi:DNA invertase Pin-like site-specific DNA recombinase